MTRVDVRELTPGPDEGDCACLGGEPFTGVAFDLWPGGGLKEEWTLRDGARWGPQRFWAEGGRLARAAYMVDGAPHGVARRWWPDGRQASVAVYRCGVAVRYRTWDEAGRLTADYALRPDAPDAEAVRRLGPAFAEMVARYPVPAEFAEPAEEEWR